MAVLKIGIVEDELIIARNIMATLDELGYQYCEPAINYTEAIKMIEEEKPDLLLLDIILSGKKDGLDVAAFVNKNCPIPFILLTALSDAATVERAKQVKPAAYLIKPFNKEELFTAIEIAFSNFAFGSDNNAEERTTVYSTDDVLFLKEDFKFHKILISEILYIESNRNYISLFLTGERKFIIRSGINNFHHKLPKSIFLQVHRSYIINIKHVDTFDTAEIIVKGNKVPLGKTHRHEIIKKLGIAG